MRTHSSAADPDDPDSLFVAVTCPDVFAGGCSDVEQVTADNVELLEETISEMERDHPDSAHLAPQLFCARVRGMRPQGAV